MGLTPREYLHQLLGPKDRRWVDSLKDERCWELAEILSGVRENVREAFNSGEYSHWR